MSIINYKKFYLECYKDLDVGTFLQPWYLDAVTNKKWDVVLSVKNNRIQGILIFHKVRYKKFFTMITNIPYSSPVCPVICVPEKMSDFKKQKFRRKVLAELYSLLPSYDLLSLSLSSSTVDLRPLLWKGFQENAGYTSLVSKSVSIDEATKKFKGELRTSIRKAESYVEIVWNSEKVSEIYYLLRSTLEEKEVGLRMDASTFDKWYKIGRVNGSIHSVAAFSLESGLLASVGVFIKSKGTFYYIFGGINKEMRHLSSQSLVVKSALEYALSKNYNFDFEGSSIESIDSFFLSFCPDIEKYPKVRKYRSTTLKVIDTIFK